MSDRDKTMWLIKKEAENYEYAFIGSSRVFNVIDVVQIDSVIQSNGLNMGIGGSDFRYNYLTLKVFLEKNNIETLFLQIDPFVLYSNQVYNEPIYDHYFIDYSTDSSVLNALLDYNHAFKVKLYRIFPILKYIEFNQVYSFNEALRILQKDKPYVESKGTMLRPDKRDKSLGDYQSLIYNQFLLENGLYLERIIQICREYGVELVLFSTPILNYESTLQTYYSSFHNYVDSLTDYQKIPYYDYFNSPMLNDTELWNDNIHLNKTGSILFSRKISEMVESEINKSDD